MQVERFWPEAGGPQVRACYAMYAAGAPADFPGVPAMSQRAFTGWLRWGWAEAPRHTWLATGPDGQPAGWYALDLPDRENAHLAPIALLIAPDLRRAGLGTALLAHAAGQAAAHGRSVLSADAPQGSAAGAFFRALGGEAGTTEVHRLLRLGDVPAGRLDALRAQAQAAAGGYSLLSWEGPVPDQHVAAFAALAEGMNDAPRGAAHEGQRWDAERVRLNEQRTAGQGLRIYSVAAADTRGELTAVTQLSVDPHYPDWGFQDLTVVAGPHRGHRLGLLVKVGMLDLLARREPRLATIVTGNADANKHMIAINEQLGFTELDRWVGWDLPVRQALALPQR